MGKERNVLISHWGIHNKKPNDDGNLSDRRQFELNMGSKSGFSFFLKEKIPENSLAKLLCYWFERKFNQFACCVRKSLELKLHVNLTIDNNLIDWFVLWIIQTNQKKREITTGRY